MADTQAPTAPLAPQGSALPRSMQTRLAAMEASDPTTTPPAPPAPPAPTPEATAAAALDGTVTVSRQEYNDLQANAGKTQAAVARAENERLQREEMAHRLTEVEKLSKSVPEAAPPAPAITVDTVEFTADEEKDFGDSKEYISKVVKAQLAPIMGTINALITELRTKVAAAEQTATGAVNTVQQASADSFLSQVHASVPNLAQIKSHKNWGDYLDETDELSGATIEQLLSHNIHKKNLGPVAKIYKRFTDKYMSDTAPNTAGYNGAAPTGGGTDLPTTPPVQGKLKQSDRRKASEDYRKGKITYEQLQVVSKAFDEADKNGNIEYDK